MLRRARLALLLCIASSVDCQSASAPEERGRQIYLHGKSASKAAITATVGGDARVNASVLPCANCHGADGRGRAESGIVPSNLTWDVLTKPYALTSSSGRTRPAYDERLLRRAITMGIDSAGNTLSPAMPRYDLSLLDAKDLIAYLHKLGTLPEPGVSSAGIRLGVALPPAADSAKVVRASLTSFFANVNRGGGIFGRRIDVEFLDVPANPDRRAQSVKDFIEQQQLFAILGDFSGYEAQLSAGLRADQAPAIAFAAAFPDVDSGPHASLFYLDGGVLAEQREVVRFVASQRRKHQGTDIVFTSRDDLSQQAARRLWQELHAAGVPSEITTSPARVASADVVFWLNRNPGAAKLSPPGAHATVLVPASLFAAATLPFFPNATTYIAQNADSTRRTSNASAQELWDRAATAGALFDEAVRSSGRNLTRSALVQSLENLQDVRTNLAEPISFAAGRHLGSTEVQIFQLDPASGELRPFSESSATKSDRQ